MTARAVETLRAARQCILTDRTAMADAHMRPDNTLDEDGAAGVAEYDAVLAQIDATLAAHDAAELVSAALAAQQPAAVPSAHDIRAIVQQAYMALEELQGPGFLIGGVMHYRIGLILPKLNEAIDMLAAAPSAQPVAQFSGATVLPDGSAFSTASFPLPKDHWLYAPRGEWDNERDEYAECPQPILTNAQRDAVRTATRYAIRGATMCGQDQDFDPDALVLNVCYALCGPANGAVLPADAAAPSAPQQKGDAR